VLAFLLAHRRQTRSTGASYNASTVIDVNVNVNLSTGIFPNQICHDPNRCFNPQSAARRSAGRRKSLALSFGHRPPESGQALEAAEGVWWIRMALPFALDHINLWLLADAVGNAHRRSTRLDRGGLRRDQPCDARSLAPSDGRPHEGFACFARGGHAHAPRSHGSGALAVPNVQCTIVDECHRVPSSAVGLHRCIEASAGCSTRRFFADHGWNRPSRQQQIKDRVSIYADAAWPLLPEAYHRLMQGRELQIGGRTWRCISGWGHSPEHMALHCEAANVLISGAHGAAQNFHQRSVCTPIAPEANALALFMQSLHHF